jgi:hypothetical protein
MLVLKPDCESVLALLATLVPEAQRNMKRVSLYTVLSLWLVTEIQVFSMNKKPRSSAQSA